MGIRQYLPDRLRSRYATKLFGVSFLIVLLIGSAGTLMAVQLSDRVTDEQLQSVEANAELEADALARWIEGEQESIRILSKHRGIDPDDRAETRATLTAELAAMPDALASLHVAERPANPPSNGTTEQIIASTQEDLEGRPLAATNIDWGEDTDGNRQQYVFEGQDDVLLSWVYVDGDEMSVAIASPTPDGDHVVIGEYRPSVRIQESTNIVEGTDTLVLGGVSAYVMFDETNPSEFWPYKDDRESTEVGSRILDRDDQFSTLNGSEIDDTEVRGYHSVPADGVNWVVVKEAPRSNALALTDQVQNDLTVLLGTMLVGFLLIGGVIQYGPIRSIKQLSEQANSIARGDLTVEIEDDGRIDEIGQLRESFRNTQSHIETISKQAGALSRQAFDADVLDDEIPGPVGDSIATMHEDLERLITQLDTERERYSTLIQQSTDGIVVVRDGHYEFVSDTFLDITGYSRQQLLTMAFESLITPEDRDRARNLCQDQLADGPSMDHSRFGLITKQGERRMVELSSSRIEHDDNPAVLINVQDVTDRHRRERRLEIFNRVLRHNLRQTLQIVTAVLKKVDTGDISETVPVASARQRSDELVDTAAKARRIDSSFRTLEIRTHDLAELLSSLEARANAEYPEATVEFPSKSARVEAAHMLESALWELLENALEHAGETPQVELGLDVGAETATLSITDDGPGVPPTERETINSGTETDLQHASGLGLWFAYWTVEASSGDLSFDTSHGSTVSVTLPLATTQQSAADLSSPASADE